MICVLFQDEISKQVPFVIFGVECLLFAALLLCLPETAGMPLEDMLEPVKQEFLSNSLNDTAEMERMEQNHEENENETQIKCLKKMETNKNDFSV